MPKTHRLLTRRFLTWTERGNHLTRLDARRPRRQTRIIPFASLLVSQLVASSSVHAGTDIDLSVIMVSRRYLGESLTLPAECGRSKVPQSRLGPMAACATSTALASALRAKS
jgi:hypothetical protein